MNISAKNILLTLLVIGTFVVCALMVFVYLELRATPAQTAQRYQEQQEIEMLTPNKNTSAVYGNASTVVPYSNTATIMDNQEQNILQNEVLTSGNAEKKNNKKAEQADANLVLESTVLVERELKPINVHQETTPSGNSNRELVAIEEKKERAVKPTHKENKKANQAIDELF